MAVVNNFWLRDNKQKLGGAVIYQAKGQTLMRQLAPSISNPRTDAQMETRVKLANLVAFYRASAKWMRGAFETKPANQSDYNAFVSANAAGNNVYLTKSQVDAGNAIVAPYQVTRGSLGEITQVSGNNVITTNIYVGELALGENTTVAEFSAAILNNNNGLQESDQLSVVQYIQNTATDGNYTITCRAYEVILDLSDGTLLGNFLPLAILRSSGGNTSALQMYTENFTGGGAFIFSRTIGGRILVTSSYVTLSSNNTIYAIMTTENQKRSAIRSYGSNTTVFLDSNLANSANSNVQTNAAILALIIDGVTYRPGDMLPGSYANGTEINVLFSTPVTLSPDKSLQILSGTQTIVDADSALTETTTTTLAEYSVIGDAEYTGTSGDAARVEVELADDSVLGAAFTIDGTLE